MLEHYGRNGGPIHRKGCGVPQNGTPQDTVHYKKKDTSVTFWAERIFFCHAYDTSMTIIVTKPSIIIDVVGSYFYDKKS